MTLPPELRERAIEQAHKTKAYLPMQADIGSLFIAGVEWMYGEPLDGLAQLKHCYEVLEAHRAELEAKLKAAEEQIKKLHNLIIPSDDAIRDLVRKANLE